MKQSAIFWVLLFSFVLACRSAPPVDVPEGAKPHIGDSWFDWRAKTLGITPEQARARDAKLPNGEDGEVPPPGTLDANTRIEAGLLWKAECARCHGMDGKPPPAEPGQAHPRTWGGMGPAMGFTFGGNKMRAGVYKKIWLGAGAMPGWKGYLSREQTWALVAHIENI